MYAVTVRPFHLQDHASVLALYAAARPLGMSLPEQDGDDACRFVAVEPDTGGIVGYGSANADSTSDMKLVVHPHWQRRGIGTSLWKNLRADRVSHGAVAFRPWVRSENVAGIAWLEKMGFTQIDQDGPVHFDLVHGDTSSFEGCEAVLAADGIAITTLADEMASDPECLPKLYELYTTVEADVPSDDEYRPAPFESFAQEWSEPGKFQDAFFIAIKSGRYIGLSQMGPRGADAYFEERNDLAQQWLTGVLPEYRRRGIAIALKRRTIDFARWHGYCQLWTNSDNPAMRALNWKMGFRTGPWLVYYQTVE